MTRIVINPRDLRQASSTFKDVEAQLRSLASSVAGGLPSMPSNVAAELEPHLTRARKGLGDRAADLREEGSDLLTRAREAEVLSHSDLSDFRLGFYGSSAAPGWFERNKDRLKEIGEKWHDAGDAALSLAVKKAEHALTGAEKVAGEFSRRAKKLINFGADIFWSSTKFLRSLDDAMSKVAELSHKVAFLKALESRLFVLNAGLNAMDSQAQSSFFKATGGMAGAAADLNIFVMGADVVSGGGVSSSFNLAYGVLPEGIFNSVIHLDSSYLFGPGAEQWVADSQSGNNGWLMNYFSQDADLIDQYLVMERPDGGSYFFDGDGSINWTGGYEYQGALVQAAGTWAGKKAGSYLIDDDGSVNWTPW